MGCGNAKEPPQQIAYQRDFLGTCWNSPRADEADCYVPSHWLGVSKLVMQYNTMLHCLIVRGYHVDDEEVPPSAPQPQQLLTTGSAPLHASFVAGHSSDIPTSPVAAWREAGSPPNGSFGYLDNKVYHEMVCHSLLHNNNNNNSKKSAHGNDNIVNNTFINRNHDDVSRDVCNNFSTDSTSRQNPTILEACSLFEGANECGAAAMQPSCAPPPVYTLSAATAAVAGSASLFRTGSSPVELDVVPTTAICHNNNNNSSGGSNHGGNGAAPVYMDPSESCGMNHACENNNRSMRYSSICAAPQACVRLPFDGSSGVRSAGLTTAMMRDNNNDHTNTLSNFNMASSNAYAGAANTPASSSVVIIPSLVTRHARDSVVDEGGAKAATAADAAARGLWMRNRRARQRHHRADRVAVMGSMTHSAHPYLQLYGLSVQQGVIFRVAPARRRYDQIALLLDDGASMRGCSSLSSYYLASALLLPPSILLVHEGTGAEAAGTVAARTLSCLCGNKQARGLCGSDTSAPVNCATASSLTNVSVLLPSSPPAGQNGNDYANMITNSSSIHVSDPVIQAACAAAVPDAVSSTATCNCVRAAAHPTATRTTTETNRMNAEQHVQMPFMCSAVDAVDGAVQCNCQRHAWRSFYRVEDAGLDLLDDSVSCKSDSKEHNKTITNRKCHTRRRNSSSSSKTNTMRHSRASSNCARSPNSESMAGDCGDGPSTPPVVIGMITAHELLHLPLNAEVCLGGWLYVSLEDEQRRLRHTLGNLLRQHGSTTNSSSSRSSIGNNNLRSVNDNYSNNARATKSTKENMALQHDGMGVWFPTGYVLVALPMYECSILPSAVYVQSRSRKSVSFNLADSHSRRMFGVGCVTRVRYGGVVVVECRDYVTYCDVPWLMTLMSTCGCWNSKKMHSPAEQNMHTDTSVNVNAAVHNANADTVDEGEEEFVRMPPPPPRSAQRLLRGLAQELRGGGLYVIVARTHAQRRRRVRVARPGSPSTYGHGSSNDDDDAGDDVLSNSGYLTSDYDEEEEQLLNSSNNGKNASDPGSPDDANERRRFASGSSSSSSNESYSELGANRRHATPATSAAAASPAHPPGRASRRMRNPRHHRASVASNPVLIDEPLTELHSLMRGVFRQIGGVKCMDENQLRQGCRVRYVTQSALLWLRGLLQLPIKARPLCFFLQRFEGLAGILRQRAMEEEWQVLSMDHIHSHRAASLLSNASGDYSASFRAESMSFDAMPNTAAAQHSRPTTLSHSFASPRARGHGAIDAAVAGSSSHHPNDVHGTAGSLHKLHNNPNNNKDQRATNIAQVAALYTRSTAVAASAAAAPHRVKVLPFNTFYTGPLEPVVRPVLSPELVQLIERYRYPLGSQEVCDIAGAAAFAAAPTRTTTATATAPMTAAAAAAAAASTSTCTAITMPETSAELEPVQRRSGGVVESTRGRQKSVTRVAGGEVTNTAPAATAASPRVIQRGRNTLLLQVRSRSIANHGNAVAAAAPAVMSHAKISDSNNTSSPSLPKLPASVEEKDGSVPSREATLFTLHTVTQDSNQLHKRGNDDTTASLNTNNNNNNGTNANNKELYTADDDNNNNDDVDATHKKIANTVHRSISDDEEDHTEGTRSEHETTPSGINATSACALVAEHLRGHTVDSSSSDDDVVSVVHRRGHGTRSKDIQRRDHQQQQMRQPHRRRTVGGTHSDPLTSPSSSRMSSDVEDDTAEHDDTDTKTADKRAMHTTTALAAPHRRRHRRAHTYSAAAHSTLSSSATAHPRAESQAIASLRRALDDARATLEEVHFLLANARAQWAALEREHVRLAGYFLPHTVHACAALTPLYLKTLRQFPGEVPVCELREDWLPLFMTLIAVPHSTLFGYSATSDAAPVRGTCIVDGTQQTWSRNVAMRSIPPARRAGDAVSTGCTSDHGNMLRGHAHDMDIRAHEDEDGNSTARMRVWNGDGGTPCVCTGTGIHDEEKDAGRARRGMEQAWEPFRYAHLVSAQAARDEAYSRELFHSGVVSYTVEKGCAVLPPARKMDTLTIATPPCCHLVGPQCAAPLAATAEASAVAAAGYDGGGLGSMYHVNTSFFDEPTGLQSGGLLSQGGACATAESISGRFTGGSLGVLAGVFHCYAGLLEERYRALQPTYQSHRVRASNSSATRSWIDVDDTSGMARIEDVADSAARHRPHTLISLLSREHNVFLRRLFIYGVTSAVRRRRGWGWAVRRGRFVSSHLDSPENDGYSYTSPDGTTGVNHVSAAWAANATSINNNNNNSSSRGGHGGSSSEFNSLNHASAGSCVYDQDRNSDVNDGSATCCTALMSCLGQLVAHRPWAHIVSPAHVEECGARTGATGKAAAGVPFSRKEMYALFDALSCYVKCYAEMQTDFAQTLAMRSHRSDNHGESVVDTREDDVWLVNRFELCIVANAHDKMRAVDVVAAEPHWVSTHRRRTSNRRCFGPCRKTRRPRREDAGRGVRMMQRILAKLRASHASSSSSSSSCGEAEKKSRTVGAGRVCDGEVAVRGNHLRDAGAPLRRCEVELPYCGGEEMPHDCTAKAGQRLFRAMQRALGRWKARPRSVEDECAAYRACISLTML